ncbi:zinc-dependent alcohol dehydrogenase family protein [Lactobacillus hamsteri]|uniref:L-threonine 3-dehydrogenase n=1 Tax=Lactobacillus hamsteri DSM 5661 = JCM 6256 TaxID=1423754 RepID=A0A0R1YDL4_9LACO|nr:zinc-dependent alcohol dehydrogenase family protein [Lactobacillus hamsteri]KRM40542.1 L-threonine 3-dehydrogenase [Lactobacillus hamsteri DSM 5661 = JCM 6256]
MKALVLTATKKLEEKEVPEPQIKDDEVLVKTAYAGICGTDRELYNGLPGSAQANPPIILGHENSGIVVKIGTKVTNVKVGDHVTVDPNIYCGQCYYCRTSRPELCEHLSAVGVTRDGGFAEYFSAPAKVVYPISNKLSLKAAAVAEPLSCAMHGINLLKLHPYQKALVIGDGFMGELFVQLLMTTGVHQVDLAGISDEKLKLNHNKFGIHTINTAKGEKIANNYYDVVVEAVGNPITQEEAISATRRGAQVLMFGVANPKSKFSINSYEIYQKQLTIQGSFINPYCFEDAISLLESGKVDVLPLISHELSLGEVEDFTSGKLKDVSKAIVKIN